MTKINRRTSAGIGIAGSAAAILCRLIGEAWQPVPPEIAAALSAVIGFVLSRYLPQ